MAEFTKWLENTAGKGQIAQKEQLLLFQSVFKRLIPQTRKHHSLFGKGLKSLLFFHHLIRAPVPYRIDSNSH